MNRSQNGRGRQNGGDNMRSAAGSVPPPGSANNDGERQQEPRGARGGRRFRHIWEEHRLKNEEDRICRQARCENGGEMLGYVFRCTRCSARMCRRCRSDDTSYCPNGRMSDLFPPRRG